MGSLKVVSLIIIIMVASSMVVVVEPGTQEKQGLSCTEVLMMVMPCMNYIKKGGSIPANCCVGVKKLASSAKTISDRQQACICIKPVAKAIGIDYDRANNLPAACGVDYKINIRPNMDCSTIKN